MIILGIDPGLANTGFGAITCGTAPSLIRCGSIKTQSQTHAARRLSQIYSDMTLLLNEIKPHLVAVENVFSLVRYPKAGIILGGVIGVIYLSVFHKDTPMVEITPKEIKNSLVGYGSANKRQIKEAIEKTLCVDSVASFHAADALAVALAAYYRKLPWRTQR